MEKVVLFAFNGEIMCFVHALLNVLDLEEKGYNAALVVEGQATALITKLAQPHNPMHALYAKCKEKGLIKGVCRACAAKMKVLEEVKAQDLPILDNMSGHPSMAEFMQKGYRVITF
jgi:hypothetical protein